MASHYEARQPLSNLNDAPARNGSIGYLPGVAHTVNMAVQYGQCGSLKSVRRLLSNDLPQCASLADLDDAIARLEVDQPNWPALLSAELERQVVDLRARIPVLEQSAASALETARLQIRPELVRVERGIERFTASRFLLLRWFNQWFRVPPLIRQHRLLEEQPHRQAEPALRALAAARMELQRLQSDPHSEISRRLTFHQARLDRLRSIRLSPDHAGAVAECEQADMLARQLPDTFHLFHDVNAETNDWVWDGRDHRRSAQIDHMVVGPGGVFVIETKFWIRLPCHETLRRLSDGRKCITRSSDGERKESRTEPGLRAIHQPQRPTNVSLQAGTRKTIVQPDYPQFELVERTP